MVNTKKALRWNPPADWIRISSVEMHSGGEPLRILLDGIPEIRGNTILQKRKYFREQLDYIRKGTMWEPRGHADMYGAVLTEPCSPDADFGTFFLHNEGYSTMCGHGIIALAKFALDTYMVRKKGTRVEIRIDAPPGLIVANGWRQNGIIRHVTFTNVPSFVLSRDQQVEVSGLGRVKYDIAYGGAFYAIVDAKKLGLELVPSEYARIIELGRSIKKSVMLNQKIIHPFEEELGFLYGTIFTGKARHPNRHSRNVCVFADGEVDRSATGTGVSARAALHYAKGEMRMGQRVVIESIVGSPMEVEVAGITTFGPHKAIVPKVTGTAAFTGSNTFWFDPEDPLGEGFFLR